MRSTHTDAILLSMGTRPEVIKMFPIYLELKAQNANVKVLHTGQHGPIAESLYNLFNMAPDFFINLNRGKFNNPKVSDLALLSSKLLTECSRILTFVRPSTVLVHGDTSSAAMMALAGYYHRCRVVHIEAGLRTHDEYFPFPEEKYRQLIAQLAHLHFAPTERARDNLLREGIPRKHIHMFGNTIVQATKLCAKLLNNQATKHEQSSEFISVLQSIKSGRRIALITMHRRENRTDGIATLCKTIKQILIQFPDMVVVWPIHPNPIIMGIVRDHLQHLEEEYSDRLLLTQPLIYTDFLWVLKESWIVLTDSGGVQEEAVSLNIPMLILRNTTERQEIVEIGAGQLVGTDSKKILSTLKLLTARPSLYNAMRNKTNPFGDDTVAKRICNVILKG